MSADEWKRMGSKPRGHNLKKIKLGIFEGGKGETVMAKGHKDDQGICEICGKDGSV
jgi:hypothetical protein